MNEGRDRDVGMKRVGGREVEEGVEANSKLPFLNDSICCRIFESSHFWLAEKSTPPAGPASLVFRLSQHYLSIHILAARWSQPRPPCLLSCFSSPCDVLALSEPRTNFRTPTHLPTSPDARRVHSLRRAERQIQRQEIVSGFRLFSNT